MPFYLREMPRCPCGSPATVELRDERNQPYGVFCDRCGKATLKRRNQ